MDAQEAFLAERNAVIRRQRVEREEAAERAADEARQAERQAATEAAMHARQLTGEPIPGVGDVLARARVLADADDGWDAAASYGSSTRPAMFVTAADGSPVEVTARPRAGVQRSVSQVADDALLARARASSADTWMAVRLAAFHRRRRSGAGAEVSRSYRRDTGAGPGPEITRNCAPGDDGQLHNYGPSISR